MYKSVTYTTEIVYRGLDPLTHQGYDHQELVGVIRVTVAVIENDGSFSNHISGRKVNVLSDGRIGRRPGPLYGAVSKGPATRDLPDWLATLVEEVWAAHRERREA